MVIFKLTEQNDLVFDIDDNVGSQITEIKVTLENKDRIDLSLRLTAALQQAMAIEHQMLLGNE